MILTTRQMHLHVYENSQWGTALVLTYTSITLQLDWLLLDQDSKTVMFSCKLMDCVDSLCSVSGSDMVSLQNQGSLKWLCGEPNGSCNCTREKLLAWEMWHMSWEGSQISLKSLHGRFLCAEWNAGRVVANRRECKEWELWRVTDTEGIPFTGAGDCCVWEENCCADAIM